MTLDNIKLFLKDYFGKFEVPAHNADDLATLNKIEALVKANFEKLTRPARYVLGLAIDFLLQAQELSEVDPELQCSRPKLTESDLFKRYSRVTERSGQKSNTLTFNYGGKSVGIRKFEEAVTAFFHAQKRTEYPSAYVYNTGQWAKNTDLLVACFSLSTGGRYIAACNLLGYGLSKLEENKFFGRKSERVRLFEKIIMHYPRGNADENGGLAFQSIANGFFIADRPHLCVVSDKVRTGSARQKRIGDIDCYKGLDLECSVEVKDIQISKDNIERHLRTFANDVADQGVLGIAFVDDLIFGGLPESITKPLVFVTMSDVLKAVKTWDWAKQDIAVHGMLHYLSHIEQSPLAARRLLDFIAQHDPKHASLDF
ncbi:MAG: hypothetical protein ACK58T_48040 [Phycisphaerae bacterium]|jgi:hypothetical protein